MALELFVDRGFEETTVDDIATRLGVGRRTVFRYFPSKNDIVWGDFDAVVNRLRADLAAQDNRLSIITAVSNAVVSSNRYPAEAMVELRARIRLITTVPALQGHSMIRYHAWRHAVAEYAAGRRGESPEAAWPQTLGAVALATSMSAFTVWAAGSKEDLETTLISAFTTLASGFQDA